MPTVHLNCVLNGISGHFDDLVFRRYRGKTVTQRKPRFTLPWGAGTLRTRNTFAGGSAFAARVGADPVLRAYYHQRGARRQLNFRQMAIRDYFSIPEVCGLRRNGYLPDQGGLVHINAGGKVGLCRLRPAVDAAGGPRLGDGDAPRDPPPLWPFVAPPPPADAV